MPAMAMTHDIDPRQAIWDAVGDLSGCDVMHNQVLCAIYERPAKTSGGIILPDATRDEDRYQGKVGLIVKVGPRAFDDPSGQWGWPPDISVGDWVSFRASDGIAHTVNKKMCRLVRDEDLKMRISHPDQVW